MELCNFHLWTLKFATQLPVQSKIQWSGSQPAHLASLLWQMSCMILRNRAPAFPVMSKGFAPGPMAKAISPYKVDKIPWIRRITTSPLSPPQLASNSSGPLLFFPKSLLSPSEGKAPSQPSVWSELVWTQMTSWAGRSQLTNSPRRMELGKHHTPTSSGKLFANVSAATPGIRGCVALGTLCSASSSSGGKSLFTCSSHPPEIPQKTAINPHSWSHFLYEMPCRLNFLKVIHTSDRGGISCFHPPTSSHHSPNTY